MFDRFAFATAVVAGASLAFSACSPKPEAEETTAAANTEAPPAPEPAAAEAPSAAAPEEAEPPSASAQPALAQPGARAELGKAAPDFTLTGVDGQRYKLSDLKGKTVVLEWFNPDCPFVKYAHTKGPLAKLAQESMGDKLVWLSINSGAEGKQGHGVERNKSALDDYAMKNPILLDAAGEVGKAYSAEKTPHMFIVDSAGTLVYRGGVDNAPMGAVDPERPRFDDSEEGALINYITGALADMQRDQALRLPETPPYGCSVKYQS